ncbi:MAG: hypothetical protein EOT04_03295 [Candidatus Chaera renei]|uniref:Uncharacterized protein n=1 Tax=Candidatus Chaera renei TaxID=2506947 RepID=A0A4Q0AGF4_9BACT|nr:MAG: hypothetical protein EOT04_03295 [Candidatus Chaera renei]
MAALNKKRLVVQSLVLAALASALLGLLIPSGKVTANHFDSSAGMAPACQQPVSEITRVNAQTIQKGCDFYYYDGRITSPSPEGSIDASGNPQGAVFKFLTPRTPPRSDVCNEYIFYASPAKAPGKATPAEVPGGWYMATSRVDPAGGCTLPTSSKMPSAPAKTTENWNKIFFINIDSGNIESVRLTNQTPFKKVAFSDSAIEAVYVEDKNPAAADKPCPDLLILTKDNRLAYYVSAKSTGPTAADSTYRAILRSAFGGADNSSCVPSAPPSGDDEISRLKNVFLLPEGLDGGAKPFGFGNIPNGDAASFTRAILGDSSNAGPALDRAKYLAAWQSAGQETPGSGPTCSAGALGWIICPLLSLVTTANDAMYTLIATLLTVPPVNMDIANNQNGTYIAWNAVRTIANVVFVIAFLFMVFSQATSVGLSNYGFKKMLPRLLAGAILVNISYFLAAYAVDAFNLIGAGIYSLLAQVTTVIKVEGQELSWTNILAGIIGGVYALSWAGAAGAAAVWAAGGMVPMLLLLLSAAIPALLAILAGLITLIARQAILVILIVISPLAFAAYLLPNTEKFFDKWRGLFINMLMLYPLAALIFGGSKLAAQIIMSAANDPSRGWSSGLASIVALVIIALPLFALPFLMRAGGGILGKIGAVVNNPNRGPIDGFRKRLREGAESRANSKRSTWAKQGEEPGATGYRSLRGWVAGRSSRRGAILESNKREAERNWASYITGRAESDEGFRRKMAGPGGAEGAERVLRAAQQHRTKLEEEAIGAQLEHYERTNPSPEALQAIYGDASKSTVERKAAIDRLIKIKFFDKLDLGAIGRDQEMSKHLATRIGQNYGDVAAGAAHLVNPAILNMLSTHSAQVDVRDPVTGIVTAKKGRQVADMAEASRLAVSAAIEGVSAESITTQMPQTLKEWAQNTDAIYDEMPTQAAGRSASILDNLEANKQYWDKLTADKQRAIQDLRTQLRRRAAGLPKPPPPPGGTTP